MEIHIGEQIKKRQAELKVRTSDLAKMINTSRQNMQTIYTRKSIDTEQLLRISKALYFNFFSLFDEELSAYSTEHQLQEKAELYGKSEKRIEELEAMLYEVMQRLEKMEKSSSK